LTGGRIHRRLTESEGIVRLRQLGLTYVVVVALFIGCGGDDEDGGDAERGPADTAEQQETTTTPPETSAKPPERAPLTDGVFMTNDLLNCLLEADARATRFDEIGDPVILGADGDIRLASETGRMLVFDTTRDASEDEDAFREFAFSTSEVTRVRNVLFEAQPALPEDEKIKAEGCLGA
jgi:hypothetical protein